MRYLIYTAKISITVTVLLIGSLLLPVQKVSADSLSVIPSLVDVGTAEKWEGKITLVNHYDKETIVTVKEVIINRTNGGLQKKQLTENIFGGYNKRITLPPKARTDFKVKFDTTDSSISYGFHEFGLVFSLQDANAGQSSTNVSSEIIVPFIVNKIGANTKVISRAEALNVSPSFSLVEDFNISYTIANDSDFYLVPTGLTEIKPILGFGSGVTSDINKEKLRLLPRQKMNQELVVQELNAWGILSVDSYYTFPGISAEVYTFSATIIFIPKFVVFTLALAIIALITIFLLLRKYYSGRSRN